MPATALYAALLGLLLVYLAMQVIGIRRSLHIGLGDGGNADLTRVMRAQANFTEYVPMALLLIYVMERHTDSLWWAHALGILLVVARVLHAWGFGREPEMFQLRAAGAALTFTVILVAAVRLLWVWILSRLA